MAQPDLAPITRWISAAAVQHGARLADHLVERLSISRRRAQHLLRRLVAAQWLVAEGSGRALRHRPGALRQVVQHYALQDLEEDGPWRRDFAPFFDLPPEVRRMTQHAFTELLNNAIDHSGGTAVTVSLRQTPLQVQLLVSDNGCGLFERIEQCFHIDEPQLALLELSKGKLSSAPERHSGHGLYFTAKLADVLCLHANHAAFQRRAWERQPWHPATPADRPGTSVYLAIALDTPRTLDGVLRAHSLHAQGYAFECTDVPLALLAAGQALASRAEARRAVARLPQFRRADIDFAGVPDIGHAFADEMFRVFAHSHPGVELVPVGMSERVAGMLACVRGTAAG